VSVITLAEIQKGIELLAAGKRRSGLEVWLRQDLEAWFDGRVLPVDRRVAARWASLVAQGVRTGRPLPTVDSLIAATALAHELTIVSRNTKDFEGVGVVTVNPWAEDVTCKTKGPAGRTRRASLNRHRLSRARRDLRNSIIVNNNSMCQSEEFLVHPSLDGEVRGRVDAP
jgi:predicted nucleic acid-binding protein